eukprot:4540536-Amphidinium_carterae.1
MVKQRGVLIFLFCYAFCCGILGCTSTAIPHGQFCNSFGNDFDFTPQESGRKYIVYVGSYVCVREILWDAGGCARDNDM